MDNVNDTMLERRSLNRTFDKLKENRVIAVCAPAGYGKTVAITQWLDKDICSKVILSLDEYDNSIFSFCERICAALQVCQPQNQTLNEIISHPSFQSAPDKFTMRAVSTLSSRKKAVLVIDDLHLIDSDVAFQMIPAFIKRLPKNFQVILISRVDLPLSFSDLWLKGQIARVSAEQFLFTDKDIVALHKKRGYEITDKQAENINQQTQGWAIGINALFLSGGHSSDRIYDYLDDFIQSNIWEKWDKKLQDFMVHTAFLRELTPSACEAMTGEVDCDILLKELTQKGAFIIQLQKGVYRYHNLLQRFLRDVARSRGDDFLRSLLEKEGYWSLSQKDIYSAIDCFIRCKNHDGIVKCFEKLDYSDRLDLLASKFISIAKHPEVENAIKKHPHLLLFVIWSAFAEGRKDDMIFFMDEYYARYPEISIKHPSLIHEIAYVRILDFRVPVNSFMNEGNALSKLIFKALTKVLKKAMPASTMLRWIVPMETPMFHRGIRDFSDIAIGDAVANIDSLLSKLGWILDEELPMISEIAKAELFYEQGYLEKANAHAITAVAEAKSHFSAELVFCALSILVCTLDALDRKDSDDAKNTIEAITKMIDNNKAYHLIHNFSAFIARREMAEGNIKAAEDWLNEKNLETPTLYRMYADITTCRALITTGKYDSAIILLKKVLEVVCAFNRTLDIIEVQILLSIAYWKKKRGFQDKALEYLDQAVWRACPHGIVQILVNDGAEIAPMLHKLINRNKQLKEESNKPLSFIRSIYLKARQKIRIEDVEEESGVKYTSKQIEIMQLLSQGKTYKEMSEALGIKQPTLRSHLKLIYSKLMVTNMADAIDKINANELYK